MSQYVRLNSREIVSADSEKGKAFLAKRAKEVKAAQAKSKKEAEKAELEAKAIAIAEAEALLEEAKADKK